MFSFPVNLDFHKGPLTPALSPLKGARESGWTRHDSLSLASDFQ